MRSSEQDRQYLDHEADAFFTRNHRESDPHELRAKKLPIRDALAEAGIRPKRILEFGCQYGDLLDYYAREHGAECVGIEPSKLAVDRGTQAYQGRFELLQGTIAENAINDRPENRGRFDLVIIHREVFPLGGAHFERAVKRFNSNIVFDVDDRFEPGKPQ